VRFDRLFVAEWVIWVHGGSPSVTWGKISAELAQRDIMNDHDQPFSARPAVRAQAPECADYLRP
jgi:hypothetical protein